MIDYKTLQKKTVIYKQSITHAQQTKHARSTTQAYRFHCYVFPHYNEISMTAREAENYRTDSYRTQQNLTTYFI